MFDATTPRPGRSRAFARPRNLSPAQTVAACHNSSSFFVWDERDACREIAIPPTCKFHKTPSHWEFLALAVSPDGRTIASGHVNEACALWDLAAGRLLRLLEGHHRCGN
mmetsp:Transcript_20632/g.63503  ORF Transcript_20632/g.63503 Transcript_20632/m.63503 type:complete len:109 (-) Transcript_20632:1652-1978(-)